MEANKKINIKKLTFTIIFLIVINLFGSQFFHRFDLTNDKRYTLSETTLKIIKDVEEPLIIDVFLRGEFPGEFKKLQTETQQLLEEFKSYNSNIVFRFINPISEDENDDYLKREVLFSIFQIQNHVENPEQEKQIKSKIEKVENINEVLKNSLLGNSMMPVSVTLNDKGKQTEEVVFPWAIATYKGQSVKIPLLKNSINASTAEKVVSSVQHLEYAFANATNSISKKKQKKVVIIRGNGELPDRYIADFIKSVRENYYIAPFTLDSVFKSPNQTLSYLKKYDLAVIAKPTESFTDAEKQVIDQFIISGGKTIWLVDQVNMEMDSLYNPNGSNLAFPADLNLNDMFFKYGVRLHSDLIKDVLATSIVLETGTPGSATQKVELPWFYSPLIYPSPEAKNPIVTNLDGVKFEFASPIELLKNNINKTILLQSSKYSKLVGTPTEVNLKMASEEPNQADYKGTGNYPVAVLLEGKFHSVYENRVLPFEDTNFKNSGNKTKMIVISDGNVIKNQLNKNLEGAELGLDQRTGKYYANKEFMLNCVNYLLDENGLINIRSKVVNLPILDKEKVYTNYTSAQMLTIGLPLLILLLFGIVFTFLRRRKYSK